MLSRQKLSWLGIGFFLSLAFVFIGLGTMSEVQSKDALFDQDPRIGIEFKGHMNFNVEFLDTEFSPPFRTCPATAALIQVDDEKYELRLTEGGPCGNRMSIWALGIDEDGNVTGEAWAQMINPPAETGSMLGQWWLHTDCKLIGASPLFPGISGSWDGTTLIADTRFEEHCGGGTIWEGPALWARVVDVENENEGRLADGVSWEDGPVRVRFGAELTIVE